MSLTIGTAERSELPAIVELLANDPLGQTRERYADPLPGAYAAAFDAIAGDPNNELLVAHDGAVLAGVVQLTFIPNLTYLGSWRAQVEGVRVATTFRGRGVGRFLIESAAERAEARGCRLLQLTTDRSRPEAVAFYESLGFRGSHVGFKRTLSGAADSAEA